MYHHQIASQSIPPRRAFTLIELLVVISIIALIIAILLPALASARETAKSVKCLTNLRAHGQAMMSFSVDHNSGLPSHDFGGNQSYQVYYQNTGTIEAPGSYAKLLLSGYFPRQDFNAFYVFPTLVCPSQTGELYEGVEAYAPVPVTGVSVTYWTPYINRIGGHDGFTGLPKDATHPLRGDPTIDDFDSSTGLSADNFGAWREGTTTHGDRGRNAVYGDGHAAWVINPSGVSEISADLTVWGGSGWDWINQEGIWTHIIDKDDKWLSNLDVVRQVFPY